MIKKSKIVFTAEGETETISFEPIAIFTDGEGEPGVRITVGAYMIGMAGSDGESVVITAREWATIVNEVNKLIEGE